jgi:homoserine kinase
MSVKIIQRVELRVPASTSNIGPGFDALGLALGLYNEFRFERIAAGVEVHVTGEGAAILNQGVSRTHQALERACGLLGLETPAVRITQHNAIPLARGLGGSATVALAGTAAAFLFAGRDLAPQAVLDMALGMEGHPDNLTPELVGGFTVSQAADGRVRYLSLTPPADLSAVVLIPDRPLDTGQARAALPDQYSRPDVVFNLGGVAMLVASLATGRLEHLAPAMRDRVHQPYRAPLLPGMLEMIQAALDAGAPGAALSGAGSGIFAFARPGQERIIGAALEAEARRHGMGSYCLYPPLDMRGLQVTSVG